MLPAFLGKETLWSFSVSHEIGLTPQGPRNDYFLLTFTIGKGLVRRSFLSFSYFFFLCNPCGIVHKVKFVNDSLSRIDVLPPPYGPDPFRDHSTKTTASC